MNDRMLYFAYGSNLHRDQMEARCPDAVRKGRAVLADHRLVFRGVADVEPAAGEQVVGGLWQISRRDLAALDRYEGYPTLYDRREVRVTTARLGDVTAIVYVMRDDDAQMLPSRYYLDTITEGYRHFSLPLGELRAAVARAGEWLLDHGIREVVEDGKRCRTPRQVAAQVVPITAGMSPATRREYEMGGTR